jgi:DNA-binding response OmpR family regulator
MGGADVPGTVLIVEDERLLARTLSSALKEAGVKSVIAASAEQAERNLAATEFDVVVLDNRLPKASGIELLRRMRERGVSSRVIFMTAYETREVKAEARKLRVDRYVKKPFDLTSMMEAIQDLLPEGSGDAR